MSYILEALKKFEKKREEKDLLKSLSILGALEPIPKSRSWWPYILVVALLLNAGIMIWWMKPWRSGTKELPAHPAPVLSPRAAVPQGSIKKEMVSPRVVSRKDPQDGHLVRFTPGSEKGLGGLPPTFSGNSEKSGSVPEKTSTPEKGKPASPSRQSSSVSVPSGPPKGERRADNKVLYLKDGTTQTCEALKVEGSFITCTQKGGGSIINLNKVDLEKTLSEKKE